MSSPVETPPAKKPADDGKSVIDMSKMNEGQRAALQVTEAARESHDDISFVANLFMGRWKPEKLYPLTDIDPEEKPRADKFLADLAAFLREKVDADLIDRTGEIPEEVQAGNRRLGAYGIKVPQKYGGLGFSQTTYCRACCSWPATAATPSRTSPCTSPSAWRSRSCFSAPRSRRRNSCRARRRASWRRLRSPRKASAPTPHASRTEAKPDGDDFILNGEKLWCSNGTRAGLLIVACKTPPKLVDGKPRTQITTFVVEAKSPGIEVVHRSQFMGLHALYNGVIRFTNVRVPRANVIGGEGRGLKVALSTLNSGRLSIPASSIGVAKRSLQIAREWGKERIQWGVPVGQHAAVAEKIRRIAAHAFAMEAMLITTSRLVDRDKKADIRLEASMCKMWGTEKAWMCLDELMQVRGGRGYENVESLKARGEKPYPVERMMRDNRVSMIFRGFVRNHAALHHARGARPAPQGRRHRPEHRAPVGRADQERFRRRRRSIAWWYPRQWLPFGGGAPAGMHPR
jgi:alkylation response protein AidB-like acyl-CoA dehydrogenase